MIQPLCNSVPVPLLLNSVPVPLLLVLLVKHHVTGIGDWAKKTMGWGFRSQTFHLPGLEIGKGAMMADVGTLLTVGQNTLTIRLNSTLYGRTYFEHSGYRDRGVVYGMGEGVLDSPVPGTYFNGLLGVSIIPYVATTKDDYDAIEDVPTTDSQPAASSAAIYNLQGQRLGTSQRGVNIVGGTKIIVK